MGPGAATLILVLALRLVSNDWLIVVGYPGKASLGMRSGWRSCSKVWHGYP